MVRNPGLSETEKEQIEQAITEAERKTCAEIVVYMARMSESREPAAWVAACGALLLPLLFWAVHYSIGMLTLFLLQAALFALLWMTADATQWHRALLSERRKNAQAAAAAKAEFMRLGLHATRERNAVMIYLSPPEHYVEIVADEELAAKTERQSWQHIVQALTRRIRNDQTADGLIEAVHACAGILAAHYPKTADDRDELPNIVLQ